MPEATITFDDGRILRVFLSEWSFDREVDDIYSDEGRLVRVGPTVIRIELRGVVTDGAVTDQEVGTSRRLAALRRPGTVDPADQTIASAFGSRAPTRSTLPRRKPEPQKSALDMLLEDE